NVLCCERLVETIARKKGYDPVDLRRRNLVPAEAMPWVSPLGTRFAEVDVPAVLDSALSQLDHSGLDERRRNSAEKGLLRGFGVSLFAEDLHGSQEPVTVELAYRDGKLTVMTGTGSAGHGHETSFLQIAADY